jgi:hypothetical protein
MWARRRRAVGGAPARSLSARNGVVQRGGALHAPTCAAARGYGGILMGGRVRHGGAGRGVRIGAVRVAVLRLTRGLRGAAGRIFRDCVPVDMGGM